MKVFGKQIFPRTNLRLVKDTFFRLKDTFISLLRGQTGEKFSFIDQFATKRVIDYYGGNEGHNIDEKAGNLGYGFIHYGLIRNLRPERVLCVGSSRGFVPFVCALACKDNRTGLVDFVDAGYGKNHPKSWAGDGFWKRADSKRHFSLLGVSGWIDTYLTTTEEFSQRFPERKYSYIYIDGDHSYKGVKNDFKIFWPRLVKGGFMVFHDVTVRQWRDLDNFGVWKFWKEIESSHKIIFSLEQSGLGILQKPTKGKV